MTPASTPTFQDIQSILNQLIGSTTRQRLQEVHNCPDFGWDTVEQLKNVVIDPYPGVGETYPFIDMDLIKQGRGAETNLVVALRSPTGVDSMGRMPYSPPQEGRRYATETEIQTIIAWLNAGLPE